MSDSNFHSQRRGGNLYIKLRTTKDRHFPRLQQAGLLESPGGHLLLLLLSPSTSVILCQRPRWSGLRANLELSGNFLGPHPARRLTTRQLPYLPSTHNRGPPDARLLLAHPSKALFFRPPACFITWRDRSRYRQASGRRMPGWGIFWNSVLNWCNTHRAFLVRALPPGRISPEMLAPVCTESSLLSA